MCYKPLMKARRHIGYERIVQDGASVTGRLNDSFIWSLSLTIDNGLLADQPLRCDVRCAGVLPVCWPKLVG